MDLKHLVSGTDIRGIVSEFEGKKVNLTKNEVEFIGKNMEENQSLKTGK